MFCAQNVSPLFSIRFAHEIGADHAKLGTRDADMFSFKTLMDRAASRWVSGMQKAEPTAPQEVGGEQKAEPKAPQEVRRIPRKQFDAVMAGAKAAMHELTEFSKQAKSRLREDRPIKQDDLVELLHKLIAAQKRIDYDMDSEVAKSADTADTEWDRQNYNLFAVPTSRMANSPKKIVDGTVAASQDGPQDMKLLYELTVAEMDAAVARFNATLSIFPALRVTSQEAASGNLSGRANSSGGGGGGATSGLVRPA
jgi:hypothetical protein